MKMHWVLVCLAAGVSGCSDLPAGALELAQTEASLTSGSFQGRNYQLHVASGYRAGTPTPLVVMLHGCTQDATQFATATQMAKVADQNAFLAVFPEQPSSANQTKCWNWFEPSSQARGSGEPAWMAGLVKELSSRYTVDAQRVYVVGFSAGAAMAVVLGATYPDVFSAIAVGAGLEFKAATGMNDAFTAQRAGGPAPARQGDAAFAAMGSARRLVRTIVFHGTSDNTVGPVNGDQVISQWAQTNDRASDGADDNNIDDVAEQNVTGQVSGGRSFKHFAYRDSATGQVVMEKYLVDGMGHAWSGGSNQAAFTDPKGPDASALAWRFFAGAPVTPPPPPDAGTVDVSPPLTVASPAGGTFPAAVQVTLTTNEPATTHYTLDGSDPTPGSPVFSTPLTLSTSTTLRFFSVDAVGNREAVRTEVYSVGTSSTLALSSVPGEDGEVALLQVNGVGAGRIRVGDRGMFSSDTHRGILSFDTSALPDDAVIRRATLRVVRRSLAGSVSSLQVDLNRGAFGSSAGLATDDYSAAASVLNVVQLAVPGADGQSSEVELPASAFAHVNKTGRTQLRLRAKTAVDFGADTLELGSTDGGGTAASLTLEF